MNHQYQDISNISSTVPNSFHLDLLKLQQLASSIMTSNKIQEVTAYEELLYSYDSLSQILLYLCSSKEIYFVTSQLLLRVLKTNNNDLRLKISNNLVLMLNQPFHLEECKTRIIKVYKLVHNRYLEVISQNLQSLQRHQYNQALQIITHSLSQLLNVCPQEQQPHINFINQLYPSYYESKYNTNQMLTFLINYQHFDVLKQNEIVLPTNIQLYKVLLTIMVQVIDMKQNWEDTKYSQNQFNTNHNMFKNKYLAEWGEFAVQQAKIVFNLYLKQSNVLFQHLVIYDVIKLLNEIIMYSYESPNQRAHQWFKDKFVKYPQYTFPEGILRSLGEDHTFLEILHQVYTKITQSVNIVNTNLHINGIKPYKTNGVNQSNVKSCHLLSQSKIIQMSEKILSIYGRMFFLSSETQKYNEAEMYQYQLNKAKNNQAPPTYLTLLSTKITILSSILNSPHQYLCNPIKKLQKGNSFSQNSKQRYALYYAMIQITSKFIIYSRCVQETNISIASSLIYQMKIKIKIQMKQFLVYVIKFSNDHCLQQQCWKIMYGKEQDLQEDQIFTDLRHLQLFFGSKVLEMLYQCHQYLDIKFLNPMTQTNQIKQFYEKYFQIADDFLVRLQKQFSTNISKMIKGDFNIEYTLMKQYIKNLPYVRIKQNKFLKKQKQIRKSSILQFEQDQYDQQQESQKGQKVLDYFQKYDQIIINIITAIQQKIKSSQINQTLNNYSFFYYLVAILLEHFLSNASFYIKGSQPLINVTRILLKITFQGNHSNCAPSVFAFYQQIVAILSQKSFNSKQLLQIIFQTEQQAISIKISNLHSGQTKQNMGNFFDLKQKPTNQRSFELIKKIMKNSCQRLITKDIKQLDAALIVLQKILKQFYRFSFVQQVGYLKQFIQQYMNSPQSLFFKSKYLSRKLKLIQLTIQFLEIKQNDLNKLQKSQFITWLNNCLFQQFRQSQSIEALLNYLSCIQQIIHTYYTSKLFVIDVFLYTIKDIIHDINKNYRKLVQQNIIFYQTTKSLLKTILEVVELYGGQKWGTKHIPPDEQNDIKNNDKLHHHSQYESSEKQDRPFSQFDTIKWEENQRDNQLPLLVQEYFYIWVKELGRQEFQTQNSGIWTKQKRDTKNKQIIAIYSQYMHLTPNGKLPPLPKALVQKQRNIHQSNQISKENKHSEYLQLEDVDENQTKTTKQLIRLYLQHLYRLSNTMLLAIYPQIDYRLQYVRKWWDEAMIRGLKPQINVTFVYQKFILYGNGHQLGQNNRHLAQLYFKIGNYYKGDNEYLNKIMEQVYRLNSMMVNYGDNMNNNEFTVGSNNKCVMYELKREYVRRILMLWQFGPN